MNNLAIQKAAETLVDRAQQGEQNAMAILQQIGKNRRKGNQRAGLAYDYAMSYLQRKKRVKAPRYSSTFSSPSFDELNKAKGQHYGRTIVKFVLDLGPSSYDSRVTANIVARLRPVDHNALRQILTHTPSNVRRVFGQGYRDPHKANKARKGLTSQELKCLQLGYVIGIARRLQDILNDDNLKISHYSPAVGWELGE